MTAVGDSAAQRARRYRAQKRRGARPTKFEVEPLDIVKRRVIEWVIRVTRDFARKEMLRLYSDEIVCQRGRLNRYEVLDGAP